MGARGKNAGGFGWMKWAECPRCGARRPLGWEAVERGWTECPDTTKCEARREKGHLLNRPTTDKMHAPKGGPR